MHIRDSYECVTEYDLPEPVIVEPASSLLEQALDSLKLSKSQFMKLTNLDMDCNCAKMLFNGDHTRLELMKLLSVVKLINEINAELLQRARDSE